MAAKGKTNMKSLMTMAVAALCGVALAEKPEGGPGPRGGMGSMPMMDPIVRMVSNPKVADKLGLSDEQKAKLKEIRKNFGANGESQRKVREATMKQVELMQADKIDEAAVMAAIDEVFEIRKAMAKEQAKRVIAVKSVLTPEQISKARDTMKTTMGLRGERRPPRGGRRGGEKPGREPGQEPEAK